MNHAVPVQQIGKLFLESLNYFLVCHYLEVFYYFNKAVLTFP